MKTTYMYHYLLINSKIMGFWEMRLCNLLDRCQYSGKLASPTFGADGVVRPTDTCGPNHKNSYCRRPHLNVYCQENLKFHINGEINFHFA